MNVLSLQIGNAAACERWVESLPVANDRVAHQALVDQIDALSTSDLTAQERLRVLEAIKETVDLLQAMLAKHYTGKPLPLAKSDLEAWQAVVMLWWALETNYRCCLEAYIERDSTIIALGPLINLRCLQMTRNMIIDYYRIYREPTPAVWQEFYELFKIAEDYRISYVRVKDGDSDVNCVETYVHGALANLANPYALSSRGLAFMSRWAQKWAPLVKLTLPQVSADPTSLLVVDLSASGPVMLPVRAPQTASVRYLDAEKLSHSMRNMIALLKKGQTPGQLGLGADARQPGCENLLMLLYIRWCRSEHAREELRNAADDPAKVCFGMADAHGLVSSNTPHTAAAPDTGDDGEADAVTLYFRAMRQHAPAFKAETWQILNQSTSGFMCLLRDPAGTMQFSHNQLAAVQSQNDKACRIGVIQWLKANERGEFRFGLRLFPGAPEAISVKPSNFKVSDSQEFEPALVLGEVTTPATAATMILPVGWYERGRMVEIKETGKVAKLINLVDSTEEIERCTFVMDQ